MVRKQCCVALDLASRKGRMFRAAPPRLAFGFIQAVLLSVTGCLLVNDLKISKATQLNDTPELIYLCDFEKGRELNEAQGIPAGWQRGGSLPTMAQIAQPFAGRSSHALLLRDNDPSKFAEWHMTNGVFQRVTPGDMISIEWSELYSIGAGHQGSALYSGLTTGEYVFQVASCDESGTILGSPIALRIHVPVPFWKTSWFWIVIGFVTTMCIVAGTQHVSRRKLRLEFQRLEQQRMLEAERTRIARDLHDDLGANLTQIALLSELTQADLGKPELAKEHLDSIFNTARGVSRQLDEIVWAVNPANDSLESFTAYLSDFAQDYLRIANVRCRLDFPDSLPERVMNSARRHNLFLAAKEALHNVVQHAQAGEVWLRVRIEDGSVIVSVEDDGIGFALSTKRHDTGNGLKSMSQRMNKAGGKFGVVSTPGTGTCIVLSAPF